MKCEKCSNKAISKHPFLCSDHFDEYILQTVKKTIKDFSLFSKKSNIIVAISGGKDSLSLVDVLLRLGYKLSCIFINEGIINYRETSMKVVEKFTSQRNISLQKYFFIDEFSFSLPQALNTKLYYPCTVCATLRRYLLNKYSQDFDVIATGHTLDDEAQAIIMNITRGNTDLFLRLGPKSKKSLSFTQRVKPLYFLRDDELELYAQLRNIQSDKLTCPYSKKSYRHSIKQKLHSLQEEEPTIKKSIVSSYLTLISNKKNKKINEEITHCIVCNQLSQNNICKACKIKKEIISYISK